MSETAEMSARRGWAWAVALAIAFFVFSAPFLTSLEFLGGSESLNVETALEMRRGGPWWVPTLNGQPRLIKPPLTAWVTATFIRPSTMAALDQPDREKREAAYRALAWDVRWPALAITALAMLGGFEIGRLLVGSRAALAGMAMFATSLMVTRFGRQATTDVQLLLWVTWANAAFLHAIRDRTPRLGAIAGGALLGLAFMSKGPVALAETLLPLSILAFFPGERPGWRRLVMPGLAGLVAFLAIAVPWFADQLRVRGPELWAQWSAEVRRDKSINDRPTDPIYAYLTLWPMMLPWVLPLTAGVILSFKDRRLAKLAVLTFAPIVLMSCFKDKNERYLLPMAVPAALLAGGMATRGGLASWARGCRDGGNLLAYGATAGIALLGALGRPAVFRTEVGTPWHGPALAGAAILGCVGLGIVAWKMRQRWPLAPVTCAAIAAWVGDVLFVNGYGRTVPGMAESKPAAWVVRERYAGRAVYEFADSDARLGHELRIYLNRVVPGYRPGEKLPDTNAVYLRVRAADREFPLLPKGFRENETVVFGRRRIRVLSPTDAPPR